MVGFKWGRGGTLRAHISKRGKCRSFFNIKAKQPRKLKHYSTLDQKTQAIIYILNAAERGGKDRAAAIKFQAALCDSHIKTAQKWMREFKAGLITLRSSSSPLAPPPPGLLALVLQSPANTASKRRVAACAPTASSVLTRSGSACTLAVPSTIRHSMSASSALRITAFGVASRAIVPTAV